MGYQISEVTPWSSPAFFTLRNRVAITEHGQAAAQMSASGARLKATKTFLQKNDDHKLAALVEWYGPSAHVGLGSWVFRVRLRRDYVVGRVLGPHLSDPCRITSTTLIVTYTNTLGGRAPHPSFPKEGGTVFRSRIDGTRIP